MSVANDKIGSFAEADEEIAFNLIEEYLCLRRVGLEPDIAEYIKIVRSTANSPVAEDLIVIAQRLEKASEQFRTNITPEQIERSYQRCREELLNKALETI